MENIYFMFPIFRKFFLTIAGNLLISIMPRYLLPIFLMLSENAVRTIQILKIIISYPGKLPESFFGKLAFVCFISLFTVLGLTRIITKPANPPQKTSQATALFSTFPHFIRVRASIFLPIITERKPSLPKGNQKPQM